MAKDAAREFGCILTNPTSPELIMHYVDQPESYLSDLISCGVYVFSPEIFDTIRSSLHRLLQFSNNNQGTMNNFSPPPQHNAVKSNGSSHNRPFTNNGSHTSAARFRLEQDLLGNIVESGKLFSYTTTDFWCQIKNAE